MSIPPLDPLPDERPEQPDPAAPDPDAPHPEPEPEDPTPDDPARPPGEDSDPVVPPRP